MSSALRKNAEFGMRNAELIRLCRTRMSRSDGGPVHSALRIPHSALSFPVSNCHTGTKALDCPDKYAPPLPPADLRDSGGAERRADRPGRRGLGAGRANGGALGGSAGGTRGNGGGGAPHGGRTTPPSRRRGEDGRATGVTAGPCK